MERTGILGKGLVLEIAESWGAWFRNGNWTERLWVVCAAVGRRGWDEGHRSFAAQGKQECLCYLD